MKTSANPTFNMWMEGGSIEPTFHLQMKSYTACSAVQLYSLGCRANIAEQIPQCGYTLVWGSTIKSFEQIILIRSIIEQHFYLKHEKRNSVQVTEEDNNRARGHLTRVTNKSSTNHPYKEYFCQTLCRTALHCTALHCTAQHCTALHCTALHFIVLHCCIMCTALHSAALLHYVHCTALHCTALHCTPLHWVVDWPGGLYFGLGVHYKII
jgi:hypothetical protein